MTVKLTLIEDSVILGLVEDINEPSPVTILVGPRGAVGPSSYDGWIALGNVGTELEYQDWLSDGAITKTTDNVTAAQLAETNAAASEVAAAISETNTSTSEAAAGVSEANAATSATAASVSETNAATSETAAAGSATASAASAASIVTSVADSAASAAAALVSENNSAASETVATTKAAESVASANAASASETAAAASETASALSETNAAASELSASTDASTATTQAGIATTQATAASGSATASQTAQTAAELAETGAETALSSSLIAQTAAELAETNAVAAEAGVAASATTTTTKAAESASSAAAALASQTSATASQTAAAISQTATELAETNAEAAEANALTSATNASASETASASSATGAASSATASAGSATAASTSEFNAATSASTATTKASEASTSAGLAATAKTAAETAQVAAELAETNAAADAAQTSSDLAAVAAIFDTFDDRYLGPKATAPTVDNDGDPLLVGAVYWNTTNNKTQFWNGAAWEDSEAAAAASAQAASDAQIAAETAQSAAEAAQTSATSSANSATTSASNASTSETNAASSETAAATSASTATTQASAAGTSATNALSSETAAGASETAAAGSATSAGSSATAASNSATAAAGSATSAGTSETNAAASETAAAGSEASVAADAATATTQAGIATTAATNAANSETAAGTSESNAAGSATAAGTSATNAANSATTAQTAETATVVARDDFFTRYIGQYANNAAADASGYTISEGVFYWNSTNKGLLIHDGTNWNQAVLEAGDALVPANNLSDLINAVTARTNLGLGSAATTAFTDYATAAQGATADTAVQPAAIANAANWDTAFSWGNHSLVGYLTTVSWAALTGKPTTFTPSAHTHTKIDITDFSDGDYATAAQGTKADTAHSWGDHALAGYVTSVNGGAAATADALTTPRTISLGGDVTGSVDFDGSANVTIAAAVADDSHAHVIANVDGLQTALDGKATSAQGALADTATQPGDLGTAAPLNVPATGNAAVGEVVKGDDTRLTNSRAPTAHTHPTSQVTGLDAALALKAPLASPALTGVPTAPTAVSSTNTTQIASTAFVKAVVADLVDGAPGTIDTLNELAAALGDDPNFATTTATSLSEKLVKTANLSDLANAATARTNLGLGTAATANTGAGNGLEADLLDGLHASDFLRATSDDFSTGRLAVGAGQYRGRITAVDEFNDGADNINFSAFAPGTALSQRVGYSFYPTFGGGTADFGPRRAADILAGYDGAAWGSEYLAFHVGRSGTTNDANFVTEELMRLTNDAVAVYGTLTTTGNVKAPQHYTTTAQFRVKYDLYDGSQIFGMGFIPSVTYGNLNGTAVTFQTDNLAGRGWWWGTNSDPLSSGAMSLTNDGKLHVDDSITVGSTSNVVLHSGYIPEFNGGILYDPSSTGSTDTASDVAFSLASGARIVGHQGGSIRSLLEWNSSSDITIGQGGTSLIGGINFISGTSGNNVKVNGDRILTVADEGAGNNLDADTVDGKHASAFVEVASKNYAVSGAVSGDFDALTNKTFVGSISGTANTPIGNGWYTLYQARHRGGDGDGVSYASQIAVGMNHNQDHIAFRTQSSGAWTSWSEIFHEGNVATQAEAEAGTDNTSPMTPLRTAQAIASQASSSTVTSVKTGAYTAAANDFVIADTVAAAFTVTLPATPAVGDTVIVADSAEDWSTNNLTVARNGSTISDLAEDLVCDVGGLKVTLVYSGSTWQVYAETGGFGPGFVNNSANWDTAYSWGDHGAVGYLQTSALSSTSITSLAGWPVGLVASKLGYLDGVTSDIQTQLDGKISSSSGLITATETVTLTNKTLASPVITGSISNTVYVIPTNAFTLSADNGAIQTLVSTAAVTITDGMVPGPIVTLMISGSSAVTWPTMTWVNNGAVAPTPAFNVYTVMRIWKVSTELYGEVV